MTAQAGWWGVDSEQPEHEHGALSVEYAILVPLILLVLALIYVYGRSANLNGTLDSVTRDATRAATQADNYDAAIAAIRTTVDSVMGADAHCTSDIKQNRAGFKPGLTITVIADCRVEVTNLPGPSFELKPHAQFSSIIDPNKVVQ